MHLNTNKLLILSCYINSRATLHIYILNCRKIKPAELDLGTQNYISS